MEKISNDIENQIEKELGVYEHSPNCHEVYQNIFVGNYAFALNKELLLKNNIKNILNCSKDCKCFYKKENIFNYLHLPLLDNMEEDPLKYMDESNNFIEKSLNNKENILIHCGNGISRSATMLYLFLMVKKGYTLNNARFEVKRKRNFLCPNIHFQKILKEKSIELYGEE